MTLSYGIAFPQPTLPYTGPTEIGTFLSRAEAAGFEAVWVQEQLLGKDPSYEPLISLAVAAGATRGIRLASATVVGPLRNPVQLAKAAATLDHLSNGRLTIGLSLGNVQGIFQAVGVDLRQRVSRLEECVEIMRRLWTEEVVDHSGSHWSFSGVAMEPKPLQRPLPIWFGGGAPGAMRRAACLGEGWIGAGGISLDEFELQMAVLWQSLEDVGRDPATFRIAKKLYLALDDDVHAASRQFDSWIERHWTAVGDPRAFARRVGIVGKAETLVEAVERVRRAGADHVILNPVYDSERHLDLLIELFGKDS